MFTKENIRYKSKQIVTAVIFHDFINLRTRSEAIVVERIDIIIQGIRLQFFSTFLYKFEGLN